MVSIRCKLVVKQTLKSFGYHFVMLELGEVELMENLTKNQLEQLKIKLQEFGLELMDDKRTLMIEQIKDAMDAYLYEGEEVSGIKFSYYLSERLGYPYHQLTTLFTEVQGITIEQTLINNKVERVKEMLLYSKLNITDIAWKLNYSNVAHLSAQFKKVTGLSPSYFKKLKTMNTNGTEDSTEID